MVSNRKHGCNNKRIKSKLSRCRVGKEVVVAAGARAVKLRSCSGSSRNSNSDCRNNAVSSQASRKRRLRQGDDSVNDESRSINVKSDDKSSSEESIGRITRSRASSKNPYSGDTGTFSSSSSSSSTSSSKRITRSQVKSSNSSLHKYHVENHNLQSTRDHCSNPTTTRHSNRNKGRNNKPLSLSSSASSSPTASSPSSSSCSYNLRRSTRQKRQSDEEISISSISSSDNTGIMGAASSSFSSSPIQEEEYQQRQQCGEHRKTGSNLSSGRNSGCIDDSGLGDLDNNQKQNRSKYATLGSNSTSASTFGISDNNPNIQSSSSSSAPSSSSSSSSQLRRSKRLKLMHTHSSESQSPSKGSLPHVTPSPSSALEKVMHNSKSALIGIDRGIDKDLKDEDSSGNSTLSSPSTRSSLSSSSSTTNDDSNKDSKNVASKGNGSDYDDIPSLSCPYMVQSRPSCNSNSICATTDSTIGAASHGPLTFTCPCSFHYNHNDSKSLSEAYIASYGDDYFASLLEVETQPIPSCTNSFYSGSSSASKSSSSSLMTSPSSSRGDDNEVDLDADSLPLKFSLRSSSSEDNDHFASIDSSGTNQKAQRRSLRLLKKKESAEATVPSKIKSNKAAKSKTKNSSATSTIPSLSLSSSNTSSLATQSTSKSSTLSSSSSNTSNSTNSTVDYSPFEEQMNYMERLEYLTPNTRSILVDWLIDVAAECELSNITLGCGVGLVDRCLAVCEYRKEVDLRYIDGKCRYYERRKIGVSVGKGRGRNVRGKKRKRSGEIKKYFSARGRRRSGSFDNDEDHLSDCDDSLCSGCNSDDDQDDLYSDDEEEENQFSGRLVIGSNTLQLLGCGCMMIASKLHDVNPMKAEKFTYLSADSYSESQIVDIEQEICSALRFHLHIVTPCHFVHRFLRASHVSSNKRGNFPIVRSASSNTSLQDSPPPCSFAWNDDKMRFLVDYLLEITMLEIDFVPMKPSLVAAGAVYLARAILGIRDDREQNREKYGYFSKALTFYTGYKTNELVHVVTLLHSAHKKSGEKSSSLNAVYEKYLSKKYKSIALIIAPQRKTLFPESIAGAEYGYSSNEDDVTTDCNDSSSESDNNSDSDEDE